MDVYVMVNSVGTVDDLRASVLGWEALGVAGVLVSDHLFFSAEPGEEGVVRPPDPVVVLSALGTLSGRMAFGSIVANVGLLHPALVIRHFAQLAALFGGERVLAGLGAGWNGEEFAALGTPMSDHSARLDRLAETCQLWRELFTEGFASIDGKEVVVRDLPLAPVPVRPPRLMLGGGSRRLLEIAGKFADHIDLNATSRARPLRRLPSRRDDLLRKLSTTIADVEAAVEILDGAAKAAGRRPQDVRRSIMAMVLSEDAEALGTGLAETRVDPTDCAYILPAEPEKMVSAIAERQRRLGLSVLFASDGPHLGAVVRAAASVPAPT